MNQEDQEKSFCKIKDTLIKDLNLNIDFGQFFLKLRNIAYIQYTKRIYTDNS